MSVTFTSAGGSGWSCGFNVGPHTVTCSRASLSLLTAPAITIIVSAPAPGGGSLMNAAEVSSSAHDPDTLNNKASATTQVNFGVYLPEVKW